MHPLWKADRQLLKKLNVCLLYGLAILHLGIYPMGKKYVHTKIYTLIFIAALSARDEN